MKSLLSLAALAAVVLGSTVSASAADPMMKKPGMNHAMMVPSKITVQLKAVGDSGESGTAVLSQMTLPPKAGTRYVMALHGGSAAPQPSHIHKGVCGSNGPIAYPLHSVTEGKSAGVVPTTLAALMGAGGPYYINVHKSTADLATIVSCGNIPHVPRGAM